MQVMNQNMNEMFEDYKLKMAAAAPKKVVGSAPGTAAQKASTIMNRLKQSKQSVPATRT